MIRAALLSGALCMVLAVESHYSMRTMAPEGRTRDIGVGSVQPPADAGAPTVEAEIRSALKGMEEAMVKGDLASVAGGYTDDAVIISHRGEEARGREAVDKYWTGITNPRSWTLEVISVEGTKSMAVQRGRSILTFEPAGGPRTSAVEYMHVWKRDASGRLRIAVDAYWPVEKPK